MQRSDVETVDALGLDRLRVLEVLASLLENQRSLDELRSTFATDPRHRRLRSTWDAFKAGSGVEIAGNETAELRPSRRVAYSENVRRLGLQLRRLELDSAPERRAAIEKVWVRVESALAAVLTRADAEFDPSRDTSGSVVVHWDSRSEGRKNDTYLVGAEHSTEMERIVVPETVLVISGIEVPVRGATVPELADLRAALERVPPRLLDAGIRGAAGGFVYANWTGASSPTTASHRRRGGATMTRGIERRGSTGPVSGPRIEITHTTGMGETGVAYTILHELGHAIQRVDRPHLLIMASVAKPGDEPYGKSVHKGPNEAPAYAFMYFILNPGELHRADREWFASRHGSR